VSVKPGRHQLQNHFELNSKTLSLSFGLGDLPLCIKKSFSAGNMIYMWERFLFCQFCNLYEGK